jgi:hypothetical protein
MSYHEQIAGFGKDFQRTEDERRLREERGVSKGVIDGLGKAHKWEGCPNQARSDAFG